MFFPPVILSPLFPFHKTCNSSTTSLSIWPPLLEATIQPGKAITQVYQLKNLGDDTTIYASIVPFVPADELGHVKLPPPNSNFTLPNYFSLQNADLDLPTTFPLQAGQTQELVLKIRIPPNASEADHYLTFLFQSNSPGLISGSGTTTQAELGANILLTVSKTGQPPLLAKIEEFSHPRFLDSFSPPQLLLRLKNTGRTRFIATGQLNITNMLNQTTTFNLRQDHILAQTIRQLQPEKPWQPLFPLGRYTATVTITPQNSTNTISQTINFWFFPYKTLLVIGLLIILYLQLKARLNQSAPT